MRLPLITCRPTIVHRTRDACREASAEAMARQRCLLLVCAAVCSLILQLGPLVKASAVVAVRLDRLPGSLHCPGAPFARKLHRLACGDVDVQARSVSVLC